MNTIKKNQKKQVAPNSIDYIVMSNPDPIRQVIYDYGFEIPKDDGSLVRATKELIHKEGASVITKILTHHPDKKAILSLHSKGIQCNSCNTDNYNSEANLCTSCGHSNYNGSGDEDSFLDQFSDTSDAELKAYYERLVKKSNANPDEQKLASEVQMVWNELRLRKGNEDEEESNVTPSESKTIFDFAKDELVLLSVVFIAGYLVGKTRISNG